MLATTNKYIFIIDHVNAAPFMHSVIKIIFWTPIQAGYSYCARIQIQSRYQQRNHENYTCVVLIIDRCSKLNLIHVWKLLYCSCHFWIVNNTNKTWHVLLITTYYQVYTLLHVCTSYTNWRQPLQTYNQKRACPPQSELRQLTAL